MSDTYTSLKTRKEYDKIHKEKGIPLIKKDFF